MMLSCITACDALRFAGSGNLGNGPQGLSAAAPGEADQATSVARDIEEADVIKLDGGKLFALNRHKGLLILDVADPDNPALLGSLDLRGRGVEMYVTGTRVYVILSADLYYAYAEASNSGNSGQDIAVAPAIAPGPQPDFDGSQVAIIDVSNPAAPTMINKINLAGFASDSRRVGNILYVVGANIYPFYFRENTPDDNGPTDEGFVASINIADPSNVIPVERKAFSGSSLAIHVSDMLILASSQEYDNNGGGSSTRVQAIDISDPAGQIVIRGNVLVPGFIRNRFYMDDFENVLRIVTESNGFGFREVIIFTYDLNDLDNITAIANVLIKQGESLEAVRFDGPRGYAVTFLRVDPLFVLDLSDPAQPAVSGQLTVPGYATHIEPRGNRLIAVGIDDTNGFRPAVAYYNVEDPANPSELGRVVLGPPGSFTESEATYDEKAFKIVDAMGLIAMPFHYADFPDEPTPPPGGGGSSPPSGGSGGETPVAGNPARPNCINAVQLIDFSDEGLTRRGYFEHRGRVERVGAIGERIFALSQLGFQTVNISDRDNPASSAKVSFFNEGELPDWIDDCGYGYYPIDIGFPGGGLDAFALLAMLAQLCGTGAAVPMLLAVCLLMIQKSQRSYGKSRSRKRSGQR